MLKGRRNHIWQGFLLGFHTLISFHELFLAQVWSQVDAV